MRLWYPSCCGSSHQAWVTGLVLIRLSLWPSYPSQCVLFCFFFILSCRKSVLLVFRSFLEIALLYVRVVLMSMRGDELRIFLLQHLEPKVRSLALECQFSFFMKCCFLRLVHSPDNKCVSKYPCPEFLFICFHFIFKWLFLLTMQLPETKKEQFVPVKTTT